MQWVAFDSQMEIMNKIRVYLTIKEKGKQKLSKLREFNLFRK